MKQKIDREPDEKENWLTAVWEKLPDWSELMDIGLKLLLAVLILLMFVGILRAAWDQHESRKTMKAVPAEQRQPMIEIPIERTVCVKPAEGYCMEYRTNRIRTP